jgi:hypothetical protein
MAFGLPSFKSFAYKDSVRKAIHTECEQFLEQAGGRPLYRGATVKRSIFKPIEATTVRKDRKPRDSSKLVHELLDEWFEKNYHVKVRSEALYCTGDIGKAKPYGTPHYVFPVGNFKILWGTWNGEDRPVKDSLDIAHAIGEKMEYASRDEGYEVVDYFMSDVTWHMNELDTALDMGAEIQLLCDKIILVPTEDFKYAELITRK